RVGVEMLDGGVTELDRPAPRPVYEIRRRRRADMTDAVFEVARISHVLPAARIPKGHVLRIGRAVREHRLLPELFPADAVGGDEQLRRPAAQSLVALLRRGLRVGVAKGVEVVNLLAGPDEVIVLGTLELDQAQLRHGPDDTVLALRIAGVVN